MKAKSVIIDKWSTFESLFIFSQIDLYRSMPSLHFSLALEIILGDHFYDILVVETTKMKIKNIKFAPTIKFKMIDLDLWASI